MPEPEVIPFEWENLDKENTLSSFTCRAKVYGGWLVRLCFTSPTDSRQGTPGGALREGAITFVPDPNHRWVV